MFSDSKFLINNFCFSPYLYHEPAAIPSVALQRRDVQHASGCDSQGALVDQSSSLQEGIEDEEEEESADSSNNENKRYSETQIRAGRLVQPEEDRLYVDWREIRG